MRYTVAIAETRTLVLLKTNVNAQSSLQRGNNERQRSGKEMETPFKDPFKDRYRHLDYGDVIYDKFITND